MKEVTKLTVLNEDNKESALDVKKGDILNKMSRMRSFFELVPLRVR